MIEFKAKVAMLDSAVYGYHIDIPAVEVKAFEGTDRRVICDINEIVQIHCSLMSKGEGHYMILLNKSLRKQLNLEIGDIVHLKLEKDTSEYGMPLPLELSELWSIDPDADSVFHTLTKGKQRTLIHMIALSKRSETRAKKAVAIMEYLKMVNGKIDFKELNQFVKDYNAR